MLVIEEEATALRKATTRLSRRLQQERPRNTVSLNKFSLLGHLSRYGPTTVSDLAALERAQPQSLTRPLAGLEADGLIQRGPDPADGRRVLVSVTAAGRSVLATDMRQRDAWLALVLARLSPTERGVLALAADLMERISQDADSVALRATHHQSNRSAS
jgi:DNA-binding MarR family transcriptional regulator